MNNKEVCEYVQTIDLCFDISGLCVREGFGQSCGGYLKSKSERPSEREHFLSYYGSKGRAERMPSYSRLRCPELLLFIAEIAGVSRERLENAYKILKEYEKGNGLHSKEKNGNYLLYDLRGKQVLKDFKAQLCMGAVERIIKNAEDWDEVKKQTKEL